MDNNYRNIQPIIIVGAGRSGTKFLRDILLQSDEIYGIPYDINYIWRTGNEGYPSDELPPELLTKKKIDVIRQSILSMSGANTAECSFLIEKTVSNTLRIPYILKVFPEAKFIHLVRDGRAVTESAIRLWGAPPESGYLLRKLRYFPMRNYKYAFAYAFNMLKGLVYSNRGQNTWGPVYDGLDDDVENMSLLRVCAEQWFQCVSKATRDLEQLRPDSVLVVKYEELMLDASAVEKVVDFIGLADKKVVVDALTKRKQVSNLDKWKSKFTDEELIELNNTMGESLNYYGYD